MANTVVNSGWVVRWATPLTARFSGLVHQSDGFTKNSLGPDSLEYDNYNTRLQLLWEPSDSLDVLVSGRYGRYDNNGQQYTSTRGIRDDFALNGGPITDGLNDGLVKVPTAQQYADFCNGFWGTPGMATLRQPQLSGCKISNPNFDNLHRVAIPPLSEQFPGLEDSRSDRTLYGVTGTANWASTAIWTKTKGIISNVAIAVRKARVWQ